VRPSEALWRNLAALALFLLIAVAITYPASVSPSQHVLGGLDHPTINGEVFLAGTMRDSLLHGNLLRWFETDMVNFPQGQNLGPRIAHSLNLYLEQALCLPFGPLVGVNLSGVAMLALNGFVMFLVARRLLRNDLAAMVAGLCFQINAYSLVKLSIGSIHKSSLFWLPLFLLTLVRMRERGGWKPAVACVATLTAGFLLYPVHAFYALILAGLLALWDMLGRRRLRLVRDLALVVAGFVVVNITIDQALGFGVQSMAATDMATKNLPIFVANGVLDLLHPFRTFLPEPTGLPIGLSFIVVLLAIVAVLRRDGGLPRFLLAAAAFFVILAAGPYIMLDGHPLELGGVVIQLPHALLYHLVPSVYGDGVGLFFPIRALPVAFLCLALLAGYGVAHIARWLKIPLAVVAVLVAVAHTGEHLIRFPELMPVRSGPVVLPSVLDTIRADSSSEAILHLPASRETEACHRYCFLSTMAGKRSVNPYDREGLWLDVPGGDSPQSAKQHFVDELLKHGVRYVMVHTAFAGLQVDPVDLIWLDTALAETGRITREDGLTVYEIPKGLQLTPDAPTTQGSP